MKILFIYGIKYLIKKGENENEKKNVIFSSYLMQRYLDLKPNQYILSYLPHTYKGHTLDKDPEYPELQSELHLHELPPVSLVSISPRLEFCNYMPNNLAGQIF